MEKGISLEFQGCECSQAKELHNDQNRWGPEEGSLGTIHPTRDAAQ